jgi:hypothetical protein
MSDSGVLVSVMGLLRLLSAPTGRIFYDSHREQ